MPTINLEIGQPENNYRQVEGVQTWLKLPSSQVSDIKKELIIKILNFTLNLIKKERDFQNKNSADNEKNKSEASANYYAAINNIINETSSNDINFSWMVSSELRYAKDPELIKIRNKAEAWFVVFNNPMQVDLKASAGRQKSYERNVLILNFLKEYFDKKNYSPIKKEILSKLNNYCFNILLKKDNAPNSSSLFRLNYQPLYNSVNDIFNSSTQNDIAFCQIVSANLKTFEDKSLEEICYKAAVYASVFGNPSRVELKPARYTKQYYESNRLTLDYLQIRFDNETNLTPIKKKLLSKLLNYAHERLIQPPSHFWNGRNKNGNHYEVVNDAFNCSNLPDILFCRLIVKRIDELAYPTSKLISEIRPLAVNHYQHLAAPHVHDIKRIAFVLALAVVASPLLLGSIPQPEKVIPSILTLLFVAALLSPYLVSYQVDAELAKKINIASTGNEYGQIGDDYEGPLHAVANESKKTILSSLGFLQQGLQYGNARIAIAKAKLTHKIAAQTIQIEEVKEESKNYIANQGPR